MREDHPVFEVVATSGAYYVVKSIGGHGMIVDRFTDRESAENLAAILAWLECSPRRLASH